MLYEVITQRAAQPGHALPERDGAGLVRVTDLRLDGREVLDPMPAETPGPERMTLSGQLGALRNNFV